MNILPLTTAVKISRKIPIPNPACFRAKGIPIQ